MCDQNHDHIKLRWQPDLNDGVEHLVFEAHLETSVGLHLNAMCYDPSTKSYGFVTPELWEEVKCTVKQECQSKFFQTILSLFFCCYIVLDLVKSAFIGYYSIGV
jgi:hypothetical protein